MVIAMYLDRFGVKDAFTGTPRQEVHFCAARKHDGVLAPFREEFLSLIVPRPTDGGTDQECRPVVLEVVDDAPPDLNWYSRCRW